MTDEELAVIQRRTIRPYPTDIGPDSPYCDLLRDDVRALLAEVGRLRALVAGMAEDIALTMSYSEWGGEHDDWPERARMLLGASPTS